MIKIQHDSVQAPSPTFPATATKRESQSASRDKYTGPSCSKILSAAMLALAAFGGGASARELQAPWQSNGIKPLLRQSAGAIQGWAQATPGTAHSHIPRQIPLAATRAVPPAPVASTPAGAPALSPANTFTQANATPANWLSPPTAPRGLEAPSLQG